MRYGKLLPELRNNRGSILVGAIAFAIIMAIVGSGLLMLAGNGVSREQAALDNDRAFAAAETGLRIGLRWLAVVGNWDGWDRSPKPIYEFSMDDINVTVLLDDIGYARLRSHATSPAMNYIKEISCCVEQVSATSRVLFGSLDTINGIDNIWFDGPVHSNAPIRIADPDSVRFVNGPVTVTNIGYGARNYGTGLSGNNYNYGIQVDGLKETGEQGGILDTVFKNTFTHSQDSLVVPTGLTRSPDITLPQHYQDSSIWRFPPTLYFYVDSTSKKGMFTYYYNSSSTEVNIRSISDTIDGQILYVPGSHVSVLGTVKGKTTVVTDTDKNINPIGDLIYSDFNTSGVNFDSYENQNNHGVGFDQNNFIALVAGGDIVIDKNKWYLQNETTGAISYYLPNDPRGKTKFVTAALIATGDGKGIRWIFSSLDDYKYNLRVIGSRIVNQFFNYTNIFGADANNRFRFFFDRRLLGNLTDPGIPSIRRNIGVGNDLYLLKTDWREKNIPK